MSCMKSTVLEEAITISLGNAGLTLHSTSSEGKAIPLWVGKPLPLGLEMPLPLGVERQLLLDQILQLTFSNFSPEAIEQTEIS